MRYRNNKNIINTVFVVVLLLGVSLGCSRISERLQKLDRGDSADSTNITNTGIAENSTVPDKTSGSNENLTAKANLYINSCSNKYTNSVINSYRRYTSWLSDPKTGPTGKERLIYGLYNISGDGSDCAKAISEAAAMQPSMPEIEQAANSYIDALRLTIEKVNSVYPYYDQNDYKDDNFTKGKAEHASLMNAFENFETVSKDFSAQVDKIEDEVSQRDLETFKDDPEKKFQYAVTDINIKAKKAMTYVNHTEYTDLNIETMQANIDEVEKGLVALKAVQSGNQSMLSTYISSAENFIKELKELMRRVRDKKPYTNMERKWLGTPSGWMVSGSQDKVIHEYNSFIRNRSFLRF